MGKDEALEAAESKAALARGQGILHKELFAEFGLTGADFDRIGRELLEKTSKDHKAK